MWIQGIPISSTAILLNCTRRLCCLCSNSASHKAGSAADTSDAVTPLSSETQEKQPQYSSLESRISGWASRLYKTGTNSPGNVTVVGQCDTSGKLDATLSRRNQDDSSQTCLARSSKTVIGCAGRHRSRASRNFGEKMWKSERALRTAGSCVVQAPVTCSPSTRCPVNPARDGQRGSPIMRKEPGCATGTKTNYRYIWPTSTTYVMLSLGCFLRSRANSALYFSAVAGTRRSASAWNDVGNSRKVWAAGLKVASRMPPFRNTTWQLAWNGCRHSTAQHNWK
jgi:hypothetical protein